jgi:hypothetical protein
MMEKNAMRENGDAIVYTTVWGIGVARMASQPTLWRRLI